MGCTMTPNRATSIRGKQRLTKDRAKILIASGLHRCVAAHGIDELALAGGCSRRTIEKALAHETVPSVEYLVNMLDLDASLLDELLAAKGLRLCPLDSAPARDLPIAAGVIDAMGELVKAAADGHRDHGETLAVADLLRPHMAALASIINEADRLRGC